MSVNLVSARLVNGELVTECLVTQVTSSKKKQMNIAGLRQIGRPEGSSCARLLQNVWGLKLQPLK